MHGLAYDALRAQYSGKHVIVAANGPSLKGIAEFTPTDLPVFTVNAGLHLLSQFNRKPALLWLQDTRMLVEKPNLLLPYMSRDLHVFAPHAFQLPDFAPLPKITRFNLLGNDGFSKDVRIGAFTGYTAIFGLLQLVYWIAPAKVTIFGLDLGYGKQDTRAYQTKRGLDVDLHVNDRQIAATQTAFRKLRDRGIEIDHRSPKSILKTSLSAA